MIVNTFYTIMMPILIPIGIGVLLQKKFQFNLKSFSKLILYYYVPALAFSKIYTVEISRELVGSIFCFLLLQFIVMATISYGVAKVRHYPHRLSTSFVNSICLTNNGNVGIPVNAMTFNQDPFAMAIQIMVIVFEIFVTFTFGVLNAGKATNTLKNTIGQFFKMPIIYAILSAVCLRLLSINVPAPLLMSIENISGGLLAFALVSVGAQIAESKLTRDSAKVFLSSFIRLIISPLIAFFLIHLLHIDGLTAQVLWIASAMPTSRNSAALALEYDNEATFAGQSVLLSLILSSVTLPIVIHFAKILF